MAVGKQSPGAAAGAVRAGTKEAAVATTATPAEPTVTTAEPAVTPAEPAATTAAPESLASAPPAPSAETTATPAADCAWATTATHRVAADNIVKTHVMVAMSFGLVPIPLFDLALLAGNQVAMVDALSRLYGVPFEKHRAQAIVIGLVTGALPVLGVVGLSSGAKLLPGIGSLFGSGTVAITGGAVTYGVGQVFVAHFESGGSLLDLDPAKMRNLFKREVRNGKTVAAAAAGSQAKAAGVRP